MQTQFGALAKTCEGCLEKIKRIKSERKKISDIQLAELITAYHQNPAVIYSSYQWFLADNSSRKRFKFYIAIEKLKAHVCADLAELSVYCERVQWKEQQLWTS